MAHAGSTGISSATQPVVIQTYVLAYVLAYVLEKPLQDEPQAAVIGGMFGGAAKMAGDVAQIHRAGADKPKDNDNKHLDTALVQTQMAR